MIRTFLLAASIAALSTTAVSAQDAATVASTAQPAAATADAAPPPAKKTLAEKMAIAAGLFGAGIAAFKSMKQQVAAPAAPAAPPQSAPAQ